MRLSTRTRYGTRAMVDLALAFGQGSVSTGVIAARQALSLKYLESLLVVLRDAGLVRTRRGAHGGHQLAHRPEEITVRRLYEVLEGPEALVACTRDPETCARCDTCPTRGLWMQLQDAMLKVLQDTTLADLAARVEPGSLVF
jgi:Rrf2 family protein